MFTLFATLLLQNPQIAPHPFTQHQQVEVRANTFTSNRQMDPALAAGPQGNLFAVWDSRRQEHGTFGVFAQLLDPLGRPIGTEIHVNEFLPDHQIKPSVAFAPDNTAWVVWNSIGQDGDRGGIFARRFGWVETKQETGETQRQFQALGHEFPIASDSFGDQGQPSVHIHSGGNVLVTWTDADQTTRKVMGRRFSANGAADGPEFQIGSDNETQDWLPTAASLEQGWVVTWGESLQDQFRLQGRLIPLQGELNQKPFALHSPNPYKNIEPTIASNGVDRFAVAWMSAKTGSDYGVMARTFHADGTPLAPEFPVDAGGKGYQNGASVAMHSDGRFVVAYNDNGLLTEHHSVHRPSRPVDIRAQAFNADAAPIGESFQVNQASEGEQNMQVGLVSTRMLWTDLDQLAFIWHGNLLGDKRAAGVTLFADARLTSPAPPVVEPMAAALDIPLLAVMEKSEKPYYDPFFVPGPKTPGPPPRGTTFGFEAISSTGWTPPDPDVAVGPEHIVGVVNGEVAIFTKSGSKTFNQSLTGFWSGQGAGGFVFDPIAVYDTHTERFIIAAADGAGNNDAICIAVSKSTNPNNGWHKFRYAVDSTCGFLDFPNLGVDQDTIYITGDCFGSPGGNRVFMFDKNAMANGQTPSMKQVLTSSSLASLGASKNYDTNAPVGYFASTWAASSNTKMMLRSITNANSSPQLHSIQIDLPQQYNQPPGADQLGTSNRASTIDYRVKNGVVRNGSLWICHNSGHANTARTRWYEFALNGWPLSGNDPTLAQYGTLNLGIGEHNWFGDIHVDANNNAVIAFNRSSSSQYISVEYVYREAGDPSGTFGDPIQLQISSSPETGSRWGDYSGVDEDPASPGTFWNHHEYRTSGWRTWIGRLGPSYDLFLSMTTLISGFTARLTVEGALPGERVFAAGSLRTGSICPPALGTLCLGLGGSPIVLGSGVANASGIATIDTNVPSAYAGYTAYTQAVIIRGTGGIDSVKSNLASGQIF